MYVEQKEVYIKNFSFPVKRKFKLYFPCISWKRWSFSKDEQNQESMFLSTSGKRQNFLLNKASNIFLVYTWANWDLPLNTKSVVVYKISRFYLYVYMLDPHSNSLVLYHQIFHQHNNTILFWTKAPSTHLTEKNNRLEKYFTRKYQEYGTHC